MITSDQLRKIMTEARPLVEQHLDIAEQLAALRDLVSSNGGDWSALKALIKAQIKDERDETGEGKHVRKVLEKAEYATAYADMLGLSLNEGNFVREAAE